MATHEPWSAICEQRTVQISSLPIDGELGASSCTVHCAICCCIVHSSLSPFAKSSSYSCLWVETLWKRYLGRRLLRIHKGKLVPSCTLWRLIIAYTCSHSNHLKEPCQCGFCALIKRLLDTLCSWWLANNLPIHLMDLGMLK